jgi:hypothetical protein
MPNRKKRTTLYDRNRLLEELEALLNEAEAEAENEALRKAENEVLRKADSEANSEALREADNPLLSDAEEAMRLSNAIASLVGDEVLFESLRLIRLLWFAETANICIDRKSTIRQIQERLNPNVPDSLVVLVYRNPHPQEGDTEVAATAVPVAVWLGVTRPVPLPTDAKPEALVVAVKTVENVPLSKLFYDFLPHDEHTTNPYTDFYAMNTLGDELDEAEVAEMRRRLLQTVSVTCDVLSEAMGVDPEADRQRPTIN